MSEQDPEWVSAEGTILFKIIYNSEKVKARLENSSREITVNGDFGIGNDFLMTLSHFQLSDLSMKRSEKTYCGKSGQSL